MDASRRGSARPAPVVARRAHLKLGQVIRAWPAVWLTRDGECELVGGGALAGVVGGGDEHRVVARPQFRCFRQAALDGDMVGAVVAREMQRAAFQQASASWP